MNRLVSRLRTHLHAPIFFSLLLSATIASGDTLFLRDGSRLVGELIEDGAEGYVIKTNYAGRLTINVGDVIGVSSDEPLSVALESKDRVLGRLEYNPDTGVQHIRDTSFGDVTVPITRVVSVWKSDERSPRVRELEEKLAAHEDPWSGRLSFGFDGASGNADRTLFRGRAEARREVEKDRLLLYAEGHMQEQNEELTEKDIRLGLNLERDLNDRWFAFLHQDLEHDKFEDLELRSNTSAGIGYFVIKQPDHEWKLRAGIGYEYAAFDNDFDQRRAVAVLGYDYRIDLADWGRFTHKLSILPAFEDPTKQYRVNSDIGFEMPLGNSDLYAIRFGLLNEYNNAPAPGTKSLDTTYGASLVLNVP